MTLPKLLLFLTLPLYVLDQVTKFWTIRTFPPPWDAPGAHIVVVENFFHLVRVHNQGVAFGFGNGTAWAPVVFLLVPLIALTLMRVFWKKGVFNNRLSMVAVALLLCGIFGNLTDRLVQGFLLEEIKDGTLLASFVRRIRGGLHLDQTAILRQDRAIERWLVAVLQRGGLLHLHRRRPALHRRPAGGGGEQEVRRS